jgi:3-phenylpropionate/cinnamic acid dioxygenase small subunit
MSDPGSLSHPVRELQELSDRAAIHDVLARYTFGLDYQDWAMLEGCFTEDAVYDMHDYFMRLGLDVPPARGRDGIVGGLQAAAASGDTTLQHFFTNLLIDLRDDEADTRCQLLVHATREGHSFLTGAVWEDRLRRTPDGWRITHRYLRFVWDQGSSVGLLKTVRASAGLDP